MKHLLLALGTVVTLGLGAAFPSAPPAHAACSALEWAINPLACKFQPDDRKAGVGCAATMTKYIRIENRSKLTLRFGFNSAPQVIHPGGSIMFWYVLAPELEGPCRPNPNLHPSVSFDGSLLDGLQRKDYAVVGGPYDSSPNVYFFDIRGNDVDLFAGTIH